MKSETGAGSMSGAALMGLSLKRAGNSMIEATGRPAAHDEKPVTAHKGASFGSAGARRAGDNKIMSYPDVSKSTNAYKGGKGTGQGKGSQG